MRTVKGLVLSVSSPKVAHQEGIYQVTVVLPTEYSVKIELPDGKVEWEKRIKRVKRQVFMASMPQLHTWIPVTIL